MKVNGSSGRSLTTTCSTPCTNGRTPFDSKYSFASLALVEVAPAASSTGAAGAAATSSSMLLTSTSHVISGLSLRSTLYCLLLPSSGLSTT